MRATIKDRKVLVRNNARDYQRARKKEKGRIQEVFFKATECSRVYAVRLLRSKVLSKRENPSWRKTESS